jgi:hypothetical protein
MESLPTFQHFTIKYSNQLTYKTGLVPVFPYPGNALSDDRYEVKMRIEEVINTLYTTSLMPQFISKNERQLIADDSVIIFVMERPSSDNKAGIYHFTLYFYSISDKDLTYVDFDTNSYQNAYIDFTKFIYDTVTVDGKYTTEIVNYGTNFLKKQSGIQGLVTFMRSIDNENILGPDLFHSRRPIYTQNFSYNEEQKLHRNRQTLNSRVKNILGKKSYNNIPKRNTMPAVISGKGRRTRRKRSRCKTRRARR